MINFNLQSWQEEMSGLTFEFALPTFKDERRSKTSKYLAESAFSFIEGIFFNHLPNYQNFGHWGITEVSNQQWSHIRPVLQTLNNKLEQAENFYQLKTDLYDFQFIFDEDWRQDMVIKFAEYKVNLSQMISQIIEWFDENIQKYNTVFIKCI